MPLPVPAAAGTRVAPRVGARVAPVPPLMAPSGARPGAAPPPGRAAAPGPRPARDAGTGRRAAPGGRRWSAAWARPQGRGRGLGRRTRPQVVHVAGHLGRQPTFLRISLPSVPKNKREENQKLSSGSESRRRRRAEKKTSILASTHWRRLRPAFPPCHLPSPTRGAHRGPVYTHLEVLARAPVTRRPTTGRRRLAQ